jgi:hypothetical protein
MVSSYLIWKITTGDKKPAGPDSTNVSKLPYRSRGISPEIKWIRHLGKKETVFERRLAELPIPGPRIVFPRPG